MIVDFHIEGSENGIEIDMPVLPRVGDFVQIKNDMLDIVGDGWQIFKVTHVMHVISAQCAILYCGIEKR